MYNKNEKFNIKKISKNPFVLTILCFSCSKHDNKVKQEETTGTQVYVAGANPLNSQLSIPELCKNGVANSLTNSTGLARAYSI